MKHKLLIPLVLAVFVIAGAASIASANDDAAATERSERGPGARMEQRREMIKERINDRKDDTREQLEHRGPIMRGIIAARIGLGHEWIIKRLTNIVDRIDARADELAKDGKNVTDVRTHTSAARADLKTASDALAAARDTMKQGLETMKGVWDDNRDQAEDNDSSRADVKAELKPLSDSAKANLAAARAALESARTHIREAIDALKAAE